MIARVSSARLVPLLLLLSACGGNGPPRPTQPQTLTQMFNPTATYQKIGRLASGGPLTFIGDIGLVAAPGDSLYALIGLSLENRAFAFRREGGLFVAHYRVDVSMQKAGEPSQEFGADEQIRVSTYQETTRADESLLWQKRFTLTPGNWRIAVTVRDVAANTVGRAEGEITIPQYEAGTFNDPILAYQAVERRQLGDSLAIVLNPRGAAQFGANDSLVLYIEGYRLPARPVFVPVEVRTEQDSVVLRDTLRFRGGREVEGQLLRLKADSLALGVLRVLVDTGAVRRQVTALVSFSPTMVLTNFPELLNLLRFFGEDEWIRRMREAEGAERARLWHDFSLETDPDPMTPENEALDAYFTRIAIANQRYRDEGAAGWLTDRGEVFVVLGDPDEQVQSQPQGEFNGRTIRWTYVNYRLQLFFVDVTGFGGRYRLTPTSRSDFRRVEQQVLAQRRSKRAAPPPGRGRT